MTQDKPTEAQREYLKALAHMHGWSASVDVVDSCYRNGWTTMDSRLEFSHEPIRLTPAGRALLAGEGKEGL